MSHGSTVSKKDFNGLPLPRAGGDLTNATGLYISPILTTEQAANILSIKPATLRAWVADQRYTGLRHSDVGGRHYFLLENLIEFIRTHQKR